MPLPAHWSDGVPQAAEDGATTRPVARRHGTLDWTGFVTDASLRQLITLALANNRSLRQTVLDVRAAQAQYRVQRAQGRPALQADVSGTRQRSAQEAGVQSDAQASVGLAAFELDLFGRAHNLSEAALQEYLASDEAAVSARIALVGRIIETYLVRDGVQHRYLVATRLLEAREASLALVSQRRRHGTADALSLQQAHGQVQQVQVELERLDREFRQSSNALTLLVGRFEAGAELPALPSENALLVQDVAPGAPSQLLEARPDIRLAEHRLQARNASIGAARAAFFPSITLTGSSGQGSAELSDLLGAGTGVWSFSPKISLPLFDGGLRRANLDVAHIRSDQAVAAYELAVQTAFFEVSDALAAIDTLRREEAAQQALAAASSETQRLAALRYHSGIDDHLQWLDAQRSELDDQMALVEVRTQRQIALATLFRTLGGTWPAPP